jgi:hypothetical protein
MSEVQMEVAAQGQVVEMLMHLKNGKIRDAAAAANVSDVGTSPRQATHI